MFGDAFCGAGGASRGAKEAGLKVLWGFHNGRAAIGSYNMNFLGNPGEHIEAAKSPSKVRSVIVDILHLSPPCTLYSDGRRFAAHVRTNKLEKNPKDKTITKSIKKAQAEDDIQRATFETILTLISKAKPRVITFENLNGLYSDHPDTLADLLCWLTDAGFSVRWRTFNLAVFGVPPDRRCRVMIIASW